MWFLFQAGRVICLFQELKLRDEECEKLLKVRDQMGEELEDLTASLFEVRLYDCLHVTVEWSSSHQLWVNP